MRTCYNCKHYWEDMSVNACECMKAEEDVMTEEEFEKYFVEDQEGCPYWEEVEYDPI